jgi:hypothetical protein
MTVKELVKLLRAVPAKSPVRKPNPKDPDNRDAKEFRTDETRPIDAKLNAVKEQRRDSLSLIANWEKEARINLKKGKKTGSVFDAIDEEKLKVKEFDRTIKEFREQLDFIRAEIEPLLHPEPMLELIGQNTPEAIVVRTKLRLEIRKMIDRITLRFFDDPQDGEIIVATLKFINEAIRRIVFRPYSLCATLYLDKKYKETITFESWHTKWKLNNELAREIFELKIKGLTYSQISAEIRVNRGPLARLYSASICRTSIWNIRRKGSISWWTITSLIRSPGRCLNCGWDVARNPVDTPEKFSGMTRLPRNSGYR